MSKDLETVLDRFARDVEEAVASDLRALVLYGSGATHHHVPGRSDLNLLVVVGDVTLSLLARLQKHVARWSNDGIATPQVVDGDFLLSSADSYPLEILGMTSTFRVLRGRDPFEGIQVDRGDVRLQAEREVKVKTLLLRRGFLESCGKERHLRLVLSAAVPALEAILRGMLFLTGGEWRGSGPAFREECGRALGIDSRTLQDLRALRDGRSHPNRDGIIDLYGRTMRLLEAISEKIEDRSMGA